MEALINLTRTCDAMLIPSGVKVKIAELTPVEITHKLGGNFTVKGPFGLARIEGVDADALGQEIPVVEELPSQKFELPEKSELWDAAKGVYDPEIPVNIVDLGLVYRIEVTKNSESKNIVEADITLTAPGCSMGPMIAEDLRQKLKAFPAIDDAVVNIVWDPPWNRDMITEEGKMELGLM